MSLFRVPRLLTSFIGKLPKRSYATEAAEMKLTFACPDSVFYHEAPVRQIDVPTYSGAFGILPQHVPTLATLKAGVVTVHESDGNLNRVFVSSGSVTVNNDSFVQLIAEEAVLIDDLDAQAAKQELANAQKDLNSADEVERTEAQIRLEVTEAMIRAIETGQ